MADIYEYTLDVFGQQPGLQNLYTQISLIYSVPSVAEGRMKDGEDLMVSRIQLRLTDALRRLTEYIPWIAGQVVRTGNPHQSGKGTYKIVPLDSIPHFSIKDLRRSDEHQGLTMKAMVEANFPLSMLDENVIAPRNTLMASGDAVPVFLVQATILRSEGGEREEDSQEGLVLTFVGLHNVMDMTGLGWIICLLDRVSKGGDLTPEEIHLANLDRRNVIKTLDLQLDFNSSTVDQGTAASRHGGNIEGESQTSSHGFAAPDCHWAYILFPSASLSELKSHAVSFNQPKENHEQNIIPSFVSTDDVISANIFQSIVRARLPRLEDQGVPSNVPITFARAIDPRRFLGIDTLYPGVVQSMTYNTYPLQHIADIPLGSLAADLRRELRPSCTSITPSSTAAIPSILMTGGDIAYRTRLHATLISQTSDEHIISVTSSLDTTRDVMLSSWANQSALWTHDFGLGLGIGAPESVRRPAFVGVESLCYIMPRKVTESGPGDVVVAVCLRDEDMDRMREDEQIKKWGRWIG